MVDLRNGETMTPTDHAELARTVEAMRRAEHDAENAPTRLEKSNASRALKDMQRFMGSTAPALLAEIAALRADLSRKHDACQIAQDQAMENGFRATQAERQRDEAVGLVGQIVGDAFGCNEDSCLVSHRMISDARTFLASLTADHVSDARQMVSPPPAGEG